MQKQGHSEGKDYHDMGGRTSVIIRLNLQLGAVMSWVPRKCDQNKQRESRLWINGLMAPLHFVPGGTATENDAIRRALSEPGPNCRNQSIPTRRLMRDVVR